MKRNSNAYNNVYKRANLRQTYPIVQTLSFLDLVVIPIHITTILLIALKRDLHQNEYYLLLNLSISDIANQINFFIVKNTDLPKKTIASTVLVYSASIFFTLAINMDRYLKIKFGLRYYQLILRKRLVFAIV